MKIEISTSMNYAEWKYQPLQIVKNENEHNIMNLKFSWTKMNIEI